MLNDQQIDLVYRILASMAQGMDFAFYVVQTNQGHAVYYFDNRGLWPCAVLALQHMGSTVLGKQNTVISTLYTGNGAQCVRSAEGMRRFCQVNRVHRDFRGQNLAHIQQNIQLYMNQLPHTTLSEVNPTAILNRQQLNDFLPGFLGPVPGFTIGYNNRSTHIHRLYMALAFRRVQRKFDNAEGGKPIAAILVDATNGAVHIVAHNTNNENYTFHAEVNLVQTLLRYFPHARNAQYMLYTTLEPCPMCAAMIAEYMPNTLVFYGQTDPGKHMLDMDTKPHFCLPLTSRQWNNLVKPLRSWKNDYMETGSHFSNNQGSYRGAHPDVYEHLGQMQDSMKEWNYHSLTLNLSKAPFRNEVANAARTLDRKVLQYRTDVNNRGKFNFIDDDDWVIKDERHTDVQNVINHIFPLI